MEIVGGKAKNDEDQGINIIGCRFCRDHFKDALFSNKFGTPRDINKQATKNSHEIVN